MNILQSILYGLISGVTELLPISAVGHQTVLMKIFGVQQIDPLRNCFAHIGVLIALLVGCGSVIHSIRREQALLRREGRSAARRRELKGLMDLRVVRAATLPMLLLYFFFLFTYGFRSNLIAVACFWILNGLLLYLPERLHLGNKDASGMTKLDSIFIGAAGALSVLPGVSRMGCCETAAAISGADRQSATKWSLLLSIPAMAALIVIDLIASVAIGVPSFSFSGAAGYILTVVTSFGGAYVSILVLQFLSVRSGNAGFAFYSWGAALFTLILYLTV